MQIPHLSGPEASRASLARRGVLGALKLGAAGLRDALRARLGLSPAYILMAGLTGELAFMQLPQGELAKYYSKHPSVKNVRGCAWVQGAVGVSYPAARFLARLLPSVRALDSACQRAADPPLGPLCYCFTL